MAKESKGGKILSVKEMTEEKVLSSSLMLLGESWKDPLFSKLISNLPSPVHLKDGTFFVNGERVDEGDESLLLTYPHPLRPGKWVTIYFGQSAAGLARARYIFFYGWDSYILFKKGRPDKRGNFSSLSSYTSYNFLSKNRLNQIQPQRLREHVSYLASPEVAGRFPGTSVERITFHPGFDAFPMFSPDGKKLVFVSNRDAKHPGEFNIFLADWIP